MSNCLTWEPISDLEEPDLYRYLVYFTRVNLAFSGGPILKFNRCILQKCVLSDSFMGSLLQVQ